MERPKTIYSRNEVCVANPGINMMSADGRVAINSYGEIFTIGDMTYHDDKDAGCAEITSFSFDVESNEVKADTEKGWAHIDFITKGGAFADDGTIDDYFDDQIIDTLEYPRILIICKDFAPSDNVRYFAGKRFRKVFIHAKNEHIEEFEKLLEPSITVMGVRIGSIYKYE